VNTPPTGSVKNLRLNNLPAFRAAKSVCEIDDKAYQENQPRKFARLKKSGPLDFPRLQQRREGDHLRSREICGKVPISRDLKMCETAQYKSPSEDRLFNPPPIAVCNRFPDHFLTRLMDIHC